MNTKSSYRFEGDKLFVFIIIKPLFISLRESNFEIELINLKLIKIIPVNTIAIKLERLLIIFEIIYFSIFDLLFRLIINNILIVHIRKSIVQIQLQHYESFRN